MYTHGKKMNGRLYVRTFGGNWIELRLLVDKCATLTGKRFPAGAVSFKSIS